MSRRAALSAGALAALAALCWAGNWIMGRAIRADVPPVGLAFWRWTFAALLLAPFWRKARADIAAFRADWRVVLFLAATGAAAFQTMTYVGLRSTEAINALLLSTTAPLWVIPIAALVLGDRPGGRQVLGIGISLVGATILVARGDLARLADLRLNQGDLWILAALVIWGCYSVGLRFRPATLSATGLVWLTAVFGALFLAPVYAWETLIADRPVRLTWETAASVGYTAVFASIVAFSAFNAAVAVLGPARSVYFLHLMPVFGSGLAILFLGEAVAPYHLVGFPIALGGVLLATLSPDRVRPPPAASG